MGRTQFLEVALACAALVGCQGKQTAFVLADRPDGDNFSGQDTPSQDGPGAVASDARWMGSSDVQWAESQDVGDSGPDLSRFSEVDLPPWAYQSVEPSNPVVHSHGGRGNVTTYGGTDRGLVSAGGACNYGVTKIHNYAAINVNVTVGDGNGHWAGGKICGQCARVWASTKTGVRETVVRITDKCPDGFCGIDLGGAPAADIMDSEPGRYEGVWDFVSCAELDKVSDGPPALHIMTGSSRGWAAVQVRNPDWPSVSMEWCDTVTGTSGQFPWSENIENYFIIPLEVLGSPNPVRITLYFADGSAKQVVLSADQLGTQSADYPLL